MKRWTKIAAVGAVLVAATAVAVAAPRRFPGAEELGQKAYWGLLDATQREQAKGIAGDYLAETAPDRLAVAARVLRFYADVAAVLTVEQRKSAGRLAWLRKATSPEERGARLERFLARTDRNALADRVEKMEAASPEEKVTVAIELFDQVWAAAEPRVATELRLTDDQLAKIRALAAEAKSDLRPVAVRVATSKAAAVQKGLALLNADQRSKLDGVRSDLRSRVLGFLRGTR